MAANQNTLAATPLSHNLDSPVFYGGLPFKDVDFKIVNYTLSNQKTLNKHLKAQDRELPFHTKYSTAGGKNLIIHCQKLLYDILAKNILQYYAFKKTHRYTHELSCQQDKKSDTIVQATLKAKKPGSIYTSFTINMYHTQCSMLVNGKGTDEFICDDWPDIIAKASQNLTQHATTAEDIKELDASLNYSYSEEKRSHAHDKGGKPKPTKVRKSRKSTPSRRETRRHSLRDTGVNGHHTQLVTPSQASPDAGMRDTVYGSFSHAHRNHDGRNHAGSDVDVQHSSPLLTSTQRDAQLSQHTPSDSHSQTTSTAKSKPNSHKLLISTQRDAQPSQHTPNDSHSQAQLTQIGGHDSPSESTSRIARDLFDVLGISDNVTTPTSQKRPLETENGTTYYPDSQALKADKDPQNPPCDRDQSLQTQPGTDRTPRPQTANESHHRSTDSPTGENINSTDFLNQQAQITHRLSELDSQLKARAKELDSRNRKLQYLQKALDQREKELDSRTAQFETMKACLSGYEMQIKELRDTNHLLQQTIDVGKTTTSANPHSRTASDCSTPCQTQQDPSRLQFELSMKDLSSRLQADLLQMENRLITQIQAQSQFHQLQFSLLATTLQRSNPGMQLPNYRPVFAGATIPQHGFFQGNNIYQPSVPVNHVHQRKTPNPPGHNNYYPSVPTNLAHYRNATTINPPESFRCKNPPEKQVGNLPPQSSATAEPTPSQEQSIKSTKKQVGNPPPPSQITAESSISPQSSECKPLPPHAQPTETNEKQMGNQNTIPVDSSTSLQSSECKSVPPQELYNFLEKMIAKIYYPGPVSAEPNTSAQASGYKPTPPQEQPVKTKEKLVGNPPLRSLVTAESSISLQSSEYKPLPPQEQPVKTKEKQVGNPPLRSQVTADSSISLQSSEYKPLPPQKRPLVTKDKQVGNLRAQNPVPAMSNTSLQSSEYNSVPPQEQSSVIKEKQVGNPPLQNLVSAQPSTSLQASEHNLVPPQEQPSVIEEIQVGNPPPQNPVQVESSSSPQASEHNPEPPQRQPTVSKKKQVGNPPPQDPFPAESSTSPQSSEYNSVPSQEQPLVTKKKQVGNPPPQNPLPAEISTTSTSHQSSEYKPVPHQKQLSETKEKQMGNPPPQSPEIEYKPVPSQMQPSVAKEKQVGNPPLQNPVPAVSSAFPQSSEYKPVPSQKQLTEIKEKQMGNPPSRRPESEYKAETPQEQHNFLERMIAKVYYSIGQDDGKWTK